MHFINVEPGGLTGLPVFADPAPYLILYHLHPELFQLLSQLLNGIADDTALDLYIGAVVKDVQTAGNIDFQRRGQTLGLWLRLFPQELVEVAQHGHLIRAGVLQIIPVNHVNAPVHDGFLHRLQPRLAAHDQLHEGEDEVAFQCQGIVVLRVIEGQVHGIDELVRGGGNVDDLTAQPPHQGRILVLRVYDRNIILGNQESVGDLPLGAEGLAATGGSED